MNPFFKICFYLYLPLLISGTRAFSQNIPKIISDKKIADANYLPDFSYAGYHFGEREIPSPSGEIVDVTKFGAIPNDGLDDSKSVLKAIEYASKIEGPVVVQFPAGRFILSEIIYVTKSNFILRGAGSGEQGTILYYPRPMSYFSDPPALQELREYLQELNKRQKEPENNIDLPFSQYAWSGGMIWVGIPGERIKAYLEKYNEAPVVLAKVLEGKRGKHEIVLNKGHQLKAGDIAQLEWFNKQGKDGSIIKAIYGAEDLKIGSHHWNYPDMPLVKQQVLITSVKGDKATIKDPLMMDIRPEWAPQITQWAHLEEVGIEHLRFEFPMAPNIAHHVEEGYNAIYLTRLFNGWVRDIKIKNADSGILLENIANTTIENIETLGEKTAHYSVEMGDVHNVLAKDILVENPVRHPLSFNTFSTKSVYTGCEVFVDPKLDQHAGANHQNLFDNITVHVSLNGNSSYPLFEGGGASYWKPSHGSYSTFWNIEIEFLDGFTDNNPVVLNGMKDGPNARLIGIHGNKQVKLDYGPDAYIEMENETLQYVPSLYMYQLKKRRDR